MSARLAWRKSLNVVMLSLTGLCALLTVSVLFFILGYLMWNGGKDLSWSFFTHLPAPVGEEGGGMANAIVGSLKLLLLAALFGVPIGLLGGVYLAEFGGRTVPFLVRYTADLMNGVPSIVMGIFAYALVVMPMHHFSTLAGGIALGVMVIPTVLRNTESFLRDVPRSLREGSFALGANTNGINPLAENVTLQIGTFSATIPAGSFKQIPHGRFAFEGVINGVSLEVQMVPLGNNIFALAAESKGVNLTGLTNPVTVVLTIGDNSGSTAVTAQKEEKKERE